MTEQQITQQPAGGWRVRRPGGVSVWEGPLPEIQDRDLWAFRYCATPIEERPRPTCGRPGSGRTGHNKHNEPTCQLCTTAERLYTADRRAAGLAG